MNTTGYVSVNDEWVNSFYKSNPLENNNINFYFWIIISLLTVIILPFIGMYIDNKIIIVIFFILICLGSIRLGYNSLVAGMLWLLVGISILSYKIENKVPNEVTPTWTVEKIHDENEKINIKQNKRNAISYYYLGISFVICFSGICSGVYQSDIEKEKRIENMPMDVFVSRYSLMYETYLNRNGCGNCIPTFREYNIEQKYCLLNVWRSEYIILVDNENGISIEDRENGHILIP